MSETTAIGNDLANFAADRATKAMRDALTLCETKQEQLMVAIKVFGSVSGAACGVVAAYVGVDAKDIKPDELFPMLMELSRNAKAGISHD